MDKKLHATVNCSLIGRVVIVTGTTGLFMVMGGITGTSVDTRTGRMVGSNVEVSIVITVGIVGSSVDVRVGGLTGGDTGALLLLAMEELPPPPPPPPPQFPAPQYPPIPATTPTIMIIKITGSTKALHFLLVSVVIGTAIEVK